MESTRNKAIISRLKVVSSDDLSNLHEKKIIMGTAHNAPGDVVMDVEDENTTHDNANDDANDDDNANANDDSNANNDQMKKLTRDARIYEYGSAANPDMKPIPVLVHPASLHESGNTRVLPFDISKALDMDMDIDIDIPGGDGDGDGDGVGGRPRPCTSPNLMASFIRIQVGDNITTHVPHATSQAFYVIRGAGTTTFREEHNNNNATESETVIPWSAGDMFCVPLQQTGMVHMCTSANSNEYGGAALYWIHDEPLMNYLGVAPIVKKFEPTLYTRRDMLARVQEIQHSTGNCHTDTRTSSTRSSSSSSSSSSSNNNNEHESSARSSIDQITSAIHELESNHPLICSNGMATTIVSTTIPTTTTEVQMAIVAISKMKLSHENFTTDDNYMIQQGKNMAVALHNHWGVGNIQCGGSGILLFLSIQDRVVYISTSNGLKSILTKTRIDHIVDEVMKPYLREEDYAAAVLQAIRCIQNYIDKGPPSVWERYIPLFLSMLPLVIGGGFMFHGRRLKKEYNTVHSKLSKIDHNKALALMGKYKCHSCPICLEDFVPKKKDVGVRVRGPKKNKSDEDEIGGADGDGRNDKDKEKDSLLQDTQQEYLGSDGREIQLLRCGHAFDKTCWETWTAAPSRNIYQCPICKQDIREDQSSARNSQGSGFARMRQVIPNGSHFEESNTFGGGTSSGMFHRQERNSINYRMYQLERNFRLQRMHFHHPRYIHQSQVDRWVRGDNGGSINDSLVQDADFVRSDPDRVDNNNNSSSGRHGSGSSSSFSSYGGGRSGGGGGGRW